MSQEWKGLEPIAHTIPLKNLTTKLPFRPSAHRQRTLMHIRYQTSMNVLSVKSSLIHPTLAFQREAQDGAPA